MVIIKLQKRKPEGSTPNFATRESGFFIGIFARALGPTPEIYLQGESPAADEGLLLLEDMHALLHLRKHHLLAHDGRPASSSGFGSAFGVSSYAENVSWRAPSRFRDWIKSGIEVTAALHSSDISPKKLLPLLRQYCSTRPTERSSVPRWRYWRLVPGPREKRSSRLAERHSLRRAGAFRYHSLRFTARQSDRCRRMGHP